MTSPETEYGKNYLVARASIHMKAEGVCSETHERTDAMLLHECLQ